MDLQEIEIGQYCYPKWLAMRTAEYNLWPSDIKNIEQKGLQVQSLDYEYNKLLQIGKSYNKYSERVIWVVFSSSMVCGK